MLFSGTVRENLFLGFSDLDASETGLEVMRCAYACVDKNHARKRVTIASPSWVLVIRSFLNPLFPIS